MAAVLLAGCLCTGPVHRTGSGPQPEPEPQLPQLSDVMIPVCPAYPTGPDAVPDFALAEVRSRPPGASDLEVERRDGTA